MHKSAAYWSGYRTALKKYGGLEQLLKCSGYAVDAQNYEDRMFEELQKTIGAAPQHRMGTPRDDRRRAYAERTKAIADFKADYMVNNQAPEGFTGRPFEDYEATQISNRTPEERVQVEDYFKEMDGAIGQLAVGSLSPEWTKWRAENPAPQTYIAGKDEQWRDYS